MIIAVFQLIAGYNLDSLDDKDDADSNDDTAQMLGYQHLLFLKKVCMYSALTLPVRREYNCQPKFGWFRSGFGADPITVKKFIDLLNIDEAQKPI